MTLTAVLAPICTGIAMILIWPQVLRVRRLDSVEGIAVVGTLHGLTGCTLWTTYGIARGIVPVIAANAAIGAAVLLIGLAQVRHGVMRRSLLLGWLAFVGLVSVITVVADSALTGWLAAVVAITSIIPQAVHAARATDLSAVSRPTYVLICASTVLWSVYGMLIGDPMVVVSNLLILPCAAYIALRATRAQATPRSVGVLA